jgi:tetratricopeptide (TPR) repeat protein
VSETLADDRSGLAWLIDRVRRFFGALGRTESHKQRSEIALLAKTVSLNPDNDRALLRLADCYVRAGDSERALSAYWHAVEIYGERHDAQKSAAILRRIVAIATGDVAARLRLAAALEKMNRKKESAEQYAQAARIHLSQGRSDHAAECLARSLALDPHQRVPRELEPLRPPAPEAEARPPARATGSNKPLPARETASNKPLPKLMPLASRIPPPAWRETPAPFTPPSIAGDAIPSTDAGPTQSATFLSATTMSTAEPEAAATLAEPDAAIVLDLQFDDPTREYRPEDLSTLLQTDDDDEFAADTLCNDALPEFDELHRPTDSVEPLILS